MKKNESSRQLLEYLREANRCADFLGYTESVKTLTRAIGKILHPADFPSAAAYMDFLASETPQGSLTSKTPQYDQKEPFQSAVRDARFLAGGAGRADVVKLIDAASIQHLYQRFDQNADPATDRTPARRRTDAKVQSPSL